MHAQRADGACGAIPASETGTARPATSAQRCRRYRLPGRAPGVTPLAWVHLIGAGSGGRARCAIAAFRASRRARVTDRYGTQAVQPRRPPPSHDPVTLRSQMATERTESPSAGPPTLCWGSLLQSSATSSATSDSSAQPCRWLVGRIVGHLGVPVLSSAKQRLGCASGDLPRLKGSRGRPLSVIDAVVEPTTGRGVGEHATALDHLA